MFFVIIPISGVDIVWPASLSSQVFFLVIIVFIISIIADVKVHIHLILQIKGLSLLVQVKW